MKYQKFDRVFAHNILELETRFSQPPKFSCNYVDLIMEQTKIPMGLLELEHRTLQLQNRLRRRGSI